MTENGVFWSLVKQDFKSRKRTRVRMSRRWRLSYIVAVAIVVMAVTTYAGHSVHMDLPEAWFFTFGLPFMAFGMAVGTTVREWKNGTAAWWLTLPVSRLRLVLSKFVAALIWGIIVFAIVYCVMAILGLYTMFLQGDINVHGAMLFLGTGLKWEGLLITVSPFVAAFGVLFAILSESRAKPAMPILWIFFIGLWWLLFSRDGSSLQLGKTDGSHVLNLSPSLFVPILISWILAYGLIRLSAYLLDRHLAM